MISIQNSDVRIRTSLVNPKKIIDLVNICLPEQGAIEFQRDKEGKEHFWHSHDTDENYYYHRWNT